MLLDRIMNVESEVPRVVIGNFEQYFEGKEDEWIDQKYTC